jgi:hypothetical protein
VDLLKSGGSDEGKLFGVPDGLLSDLLSHSRVESDMGDNRLFVMLNPSDDYPAKGEPHVHIVTQLLRLHNGYYETLQAGDDAMVWWYNGDSYATNYARL